MKRKELLKKVTTWAREYYERENMDVFYDGNTWNIYAISANGKELLINSGRKFDSDIEKYNLIYTLKIRGA